MQPVVRREGRVDLLLAECVPPRLSELAAGDGGVHARRVHASLRIGIVKITRERGASAAPFERLQVLAANERHERLYVVSVRTQERLANPLGDTARLRGILGGLVVVRAAPCDKSLRPRRAVGLRVLERTRNPASDQVGRRRRSPHPRTGHRLESQLGL